MVQATPSKAEVTAEDLRDGIRIVLDRDVDPAASPIAIEPTMKGETRWLDRRTVAFFPAEPWRPSTAYAVNLDPSVAAWPGLRFVFQRITVEAVDFEGLPEYQPPRPTLTIRTSMPVRAEDVVASCSFGTVAARSTDSGPTRSVRLQPIASLQAGSRFLFRCSAALKPIDGSEGLAVAHEVPFATHGRAEVKAWEPRGHEVSADGVKIAIEFATPMDPGAVRKHVQLVSGNTTVPPLSLAAADASKTRFTGSADLDPGAEYELVVTGGLKDRFGQRIEGEVRHSFRVGDASPRLRMEHGIFAVERASGRYPIWTRNMPRFRVRCAPVPEDRIVSVLTGPANYDSWWDASEGGSVNYQKLGLKPRTRTVRSRTQKNRWQDAGVDLASTCGGRSPLYILEVHSDENNEDRRPQRISLANVTDLALLAKVGNASSLVWVVRLSTGKPVAGAVVRIRDLKGKERFSGTTDAEGLLSAPGTAKLISLKPSGEGDDDVWNRDRRVIVTAESSGDLAVLDTNWNNGIQLWNFALANDRRGGAVRVRGFLHSDRGLYRPGETVHLRGLVRFVDAAGKMAPPQARKVHLVVTDPRGTTVVDDDLTPTGFGGFFRDLALAAEARLGDYAVRAQIDDQTFADRFSVEEYRPRTFEVAIKKRKNDIILGQKLTFAVAANYLFGQPLHQGKVTWKVRRRPYLPQFPGYEEYGFRDFVTLWDRGRWWSRHEERSFSAAVGDGEAKLDDTGQTSIEVTDDPTDAAGPQDYLVEATVEDSTGQAVTTGDTVRAHAANLYLGLHPSEYVQAVDMPFGVQVVGFDAAGRRRAASARLTVTRRFYDCGIGEGARWWACDRRGDTKASIERTIEIPAAGSAAINRVVLGEPGEYIVRVTAPDGRGGTAVASDLVYVIGKGEAFWSGDEGDRMTIVASKAHYRPGETARLVPQAQMPGALALLTIERDGILSHRVVPVATTGEALEVPVEARFAPNVFASVVLARGRIGDGDRGKPRFKMGMVNLTVESESKRLVVAIETDRPSYEPGMKVSARVKVSAADGTPVRGELALAVADEGVLQIAGYKTPDPMPTFYAAWGLGVETSTTWNRILQSSNPDLGGEAGGDAGGDEAGRIRSRFMATAFWAPALVTDAAGVAEVEFVAPDNLTAFRVMAVVADEGDRFGSAESRFTISKALQLIPLLPRFLTVGDRAQATVLVQNNSKEKLDVAVAASAVGALVRSGGRQRLRLGPGRSHRITVGLGARAQGNAVFTFRATGGEHQDAVKIEMPVTRPSTHETVLVGEGVARGRTEHRLARSSDVYKETSSLEVTLDATGLSRLAESLQYIVGYPYGCLEQTTSKVVPMVALMELSRFIDVKDRQFGSTRSYITAGVARILRFQHEDGGFGLWIGAPPEPHYTAFALWGLGLARKAGFKVDETALASGVKYLKAHFSSSARDGGSGSEYFGNEGARAFDLYVLATLGELDEAGMAQLFETRGNLPIDARAFLAAALHRAGRTAMANTLARELVALLPVGGGPALLDEGARDLSWYWNSNVRSTALVLSSLLEVNPRSPAIPRLAQGLLDSRSAGRWGNTQENLHSLLALASWAKRGAAAGTSLVTVTVGKKRIQRTLNRGALELIRLPYADLEGDRLVIETSGAELHYSARMKLDRPLRQTAEGRGLSIEREYLDPDTGAPLETIKLGQLVKVRLTIDARTRESHVAVVDPLPAGFEPVLTKFERTYKGEEETSRRSTWWSGASTSWQNQELRDDRALVFADVLAPQASSHEYFVRATTAGTFLTPGAQVEAMYKPAVRGRSAVRHVVVTR